MLNFINTSSRMGDCETNVQVGALKHKHGKPEGTHEQIESAFRSKIPLEGLWLLLLSAVFFNLTCCFA